MDCLLERTNVHMTLEAGYGHDGEEIGDQQSLQFSLSQWGMLVPTWLSETQERPHGSCRGISTMGWLLAHERHNSRQKTKHEGWRDWWCSKANEISCKAWIEFDFVTVSRSFHSSALGKQFRRMKRRISRHGNHVEPSKHGRY